MKIQPAALKYVAAMAAAGAIVAMASPAFAQSSWGGAAGRQVVQFSNQHAPGQIIVSFGDRRLYHIVSRGRAVSYPIAVPRADARWSGTMRISQKRVNPSWTPTANMRRKNPKLPAFVRGGDPKNPLGSRALYLGSSLYRIHGTDAPWTIGKNVSSGCVRMHNAHVEELYNKVGVGTRVVATWKRYSTRSGTYASARGSSNRYVYPGETGSRGYNASWAQSILQN